MILKNTRLSLQPIGSRTITKRVKKKPTSSELEAIELMQGTIEELKSNLLRLQKEMETIINAELPSDNLS